MSLDHHIYGSTDWHLPSPTSTPKSAAPDSTLKTPRSGTFPPTHFLDAWSTPQVNGQQTPAQTPTFTISTPTERPSTSQSLKVRTPEDPEFHVNHFVVTTLPLPPVEPSRRLSSSPGPRTVNHIATTPRGQLSSRPRPFSMDSSQMQTPPPTRGDASRQLQQRAGNEFSTPATVIAATPGQVPSTGGFTNQTPIGFPALQFSPDMLQFPNTGPMSAPPLPHSRLFWDQPNDSTQMDVDMPLASDPFGPTPHKPEGHVNWQTFHTPVNNQMNPQAFQALQGLSSPGLVSSFAANNAGDGQNSRPSSFISTSGSVDPSMLFSFSNPGPASSFDTSMPMPTKNVETRKPYELQFMHSMQEKEAARKGKSQHSRTSTNSSAASFDPRPGLQRSNTDSGFRKSRPSSVESRSSASVAAFNIPRRSSPLKRSSGGSLMAIPEIRRSRTRLVIDENGRARTETVPAEEDEDRREPHRNPQDLRKQYPGLWADDSESEDEQPPRTVTLSRNTSFDLPQRRTAKHARNESNELGRSNSFKVPRPISRPSSGAFDQAPFDTIRPARRAAENPHRRFSLMDLPRSFSESKGSGDLEMPDSPGDALGALKKAVEGRQKRIERSTQNALQAHNQRWSQASTDLAHGHSASFDPFNNGFSASPGTTSDTALTTPSTDRSSLSSETTRCVCNRPDDGRPMILCDSCKNWLHIPCVGLTEKIPPVYVCVFCTGQTPVARGGRVRGPLPGVFDSPLTHKSVHRR